MERVAKLLQIVVALAVSSTASAGQSTHRLYDGITAFVDNPQGREFSVTLGVRDINHRMHGPSELLVKVYPPSGKPVVREVVPDDGVLAQTSNCAAAGWDHEAWYYATCYSRGLQPLVRWSAFSDPKRLAAMPARRFTYKVAGGQKGVYRVLVVGAPDHYVTLSIEPDLKYSVAGSPEWIHGHGEQFRRSFIYVPKTTRSIDVLFLQLDEPAKRTFVLKDANGDVLSEGSGADGLVQQSVAANGALDEQVLTLDVGSGPGDFLLNVTFQLDNDFKPVRAPHQAVTALFSADESTARATQGGAIYHDGRMFWQMYQVRLYDWLKQLGASDFEYPPELDDSTGFLSVGSHNSPKKGSADRIMHSFHKHNNRNALHAALRDMLFGMRLIGHGDHVAIGPKRNLAYEQGCYTFFWYRPAWRIVQQTDAPPEVKAALREFVIQAGDRLAFCRTMATGNGNAFGSLMEALRYCYEATGDPLQEQLFETGWKRFTGGGYGDRVGIGPSGGLQESLGYDLHYGSYVMRGWKAVIADLNDPRFVQARNRMWNLYSYIWSPGPAMPWSSRTSIPSTAGGTYDPWHPEYGWRGHGGADFVTAVNDHNEWFAARRNNYYAVTYHGRLTPTWEGEGFHGQIGLGGGGLCQLHVPGHGQVVTAKPNSSYGGGMDLSQWPTFHVHSLVGTTARGLPLVAANSEHGNAELVENTVTSSANVRQSSVHVSRRYVFDRTSIQCAVRLGPAQHDNVFSIWGGRPRLRGKVTEAYEMIPFADAAKRKGKPRGDKNRTRVEVLAADGSVAGLLDDQAASLSDGPGLRTGAAESIEGAGVRIQRNGYGMLIEFDQPRPVYRGLNDTILVQVAAGLTPAADVGIQYRIVPYSGQPPKLGETTPASVAPQPISRLKAPSSLDELPKLLGDQTPREIKDGDRTLASLRMAVAGKDLALAVQVRDDEVTHETTPWRGSCFEVFGGMPAVAGIGQVFLAPAAGNEPARGYRADGSKQSPASEIRIWSMPSENGYELRALVPLALLKIDPAKEFLLEFQVSKKAGKARRYHTLFGSKRAYQNKQRFETFKISESTDGSD